MMSSAQNTPTHFRWNPIQALEKSLLFHPLRASESWLTPPASWGVQDVWVQTSDGTHIHAWGFPLQGARDAIIFCHGTAGNLSHRIATVAALGKSLHMSVLIFDYP